MSRTHGPARRKGTGKLMDASYTRRIVAEELDVGSLEALGDAASGEVVVDVDSGKALVRIGSKINALRRRRRLTLQALAAATRLSPSMLSLVERGKASPSLGTLLRICSALDIQMSDLFDFEPDVTRDAVVRHKDHPVFHTTDGVTRRIIRSDHARGIEFVISEFEPGAASDTNRRPHSGHEYGLVLKGKLVVDLDGVAHELKRGDSIGFDSTIPHRFINEGKSHAVAAWVNVSR